MTRREAAIVYIGRRTEMKYKVGDKTLLGEILRVDTADVGYPYLISLMMDTAWLTEAEIDKIIIKPKRNIDRIIELWESGKSADEIREFMYEKRLSTLVEKVDIQKWLSPYTEPSKYPKLTPDEIKAVKWLVDGGFETIYKCGHNIWVKENKTNFTINDMPTTKCLDKSTWLTSEPINLKELLDAQEETK